MPSTKSEVAMAGDGALGWRFIVGFLSFSTVTLGAGTFCLVEGSSVL